MIRNNTLFKCLIFRPFHQFSDIGFKQPFAWFWWTFYQSPEKSGASILSFETISSGDLIKKSNKMAIPKLEIRTINLICIKSIFILHLFFKIFEFQKSVKEKMSILSFFFSLKHDNWQANDLLRKRHHTCHAR